MRESAFEEARIADERITGGEIKMLTGIPIALKEDIYCTQGVRTTCGLPHPRELHSPLRCHGSSPDCVKPGRSIQGKTNIGWIRHGVVDGDLPITGLPEFPGIWGGYRAVPAGGLLRTVAADEVHRCSRIGYGWIHPSARGPCAALVGMKPTYGWVSRFGPGRLCSSLDQIGPFTKDVQDCAILMNAIAGYDPGSPLSVPVEVPDYREF
jgi:aspartyl-tRNA(Asn)/glutamyl-tRNA(Gln) amidotransferase subunit A